MYQDYVKELVDRYNDLRSRSNNGSFDDWFLVKFRLRRILNWKPFERFYQRTYPYQFATQRFNKEIRFDLLELRGYLRISYARKGTYDFDISTSLKMIDDYLEKISQTPKKSNKWTGIFWKILGSSIFASLVIPIIASLEQFYPIILITVVMLGLPFGTWYTADRIFQYAMEKLWYRTCEKNLGIFKLRNKLTSKLIAEIHN
ncbi:MAG: hypothetical protein ACRENO_01270 [Thermodesulfobacteriota bacterium]